MSYTSEKCTGTRSTVPAAPLAITIAVSLVDVSVSTDTQLNVRSITRRHIASSSAASVEAFLMKELVDALKTEINRQIIIGNGFSECQGAFNSAKAYSRTASTGVATTNKASDVLAAAWASTNSALSPMAFESWVNSVAVINSRLTASFEATFYPPLFPVFMGNMKQGTTVEGLPTIYHRLSNTNPTSGDTLVMFFDPSKYLLVTNFAGFTVTRLGERYSDSDSTAFVASVRADGALLHSSGVLNVNRS